MARRLETLFDRYRRRGDAAALGKVFDRTAPEILRVAMHLARHPAEAEDLLQETFLTAIAKAEAYDATRPLVPWLLGILKNHARAARRRRAPVAGAVEERGSEREPWADVDWTDGIAERVEALPDPYREVLVLLLRHEKTPAEIAVLLDRPPATVRSQVHRGLDRLRRSLPPDLRSVGLAALPIGVGLPAIRARVMTEATASTVAAGTAVGSGTLLLAGGLAVSKKGAWTIVAVLGLAALGTAAWQGVFLDRPDPTEPRSERAEIAREDGETSDEGLPPPSLVGSPTATEPVEPPVTAQGPPAARAPVWPPDLRIPEDKGSVAGHIRFADGTPLVGARVALWGSTNDVSTTDEQGRFHVHAEWVGDRSVYLLLGSEGKPIYNSLILSSEVRMKAGELVLYDVTIERGVVLDAVVVDARTDEPLVDAKVTIRRIARDDGQAIAGFARTDARGRFRFPYVPEDAYTLELNQEGYTPIEREFDLREKPFPNRWGMTVARQLTLRFADLPEGAVGTAVTVFLQRSDGSSLSVTSKPVIGPDGSIRVDAPEPGPYMLTVFKTEHVPRIEHWFEITDEPLEPILLKVPQGARVVGVIRDAEGEPIVGAPVQIGGGTGRSETNVDGVFNLARAPSGRRRVMVKLEEAWVSFGRIDVPAAGTATVSLSAPGTARLEGAFLLGGVSVGWSRGMLTVRRTGSKEKVADVRVGATGRFAIPMLAPGRYTIAGWADGGIPARREVTLHRGETLELGDIDLEPYLRVPVELVFPPGAKPGSNRMVIARDPDQPVSRFHPAYFEAGGERHMITPHLKTEGDGRTWVGNLPPGRVRLDFRCDGYEPVFLDVDVVPGMTQPVRVEFRAN